jgi:probable F420-dependent oxidoreductase
LPLTLALPVSGYVEVAEQAERLGYSRVWAAEAGTNDAFGLLTACAMRAQRIGLATGIVPMYTRTPSLMAQSAATLQDASGGRFILGLGVSSPTIVQRWNGVPFDHPMGRLGEYVSVVRELLAGGKVDRSEGWYPVQGYRLLMRLPEPAPIVLGALNPTMLAVAGEISDGALLNWIDIAAVPEAVSMVRAGATAAGRAVQTGVFVRVCVTDDPDATRAWARREVMSYVIVPAYRRAFTRHGWGDACTEAMQLWAAGQRAEAANSLPEAFVDGLVIAGPADEVRKRFDEFRAAGVDEPVVFPVTGQVTPDRAAAELWATISALAPDGD